MGGGPPALLEILSKLMRNRSLFLRDYQLLIKNYRLDIHILT